MTHTLGEKQIRWLVEPTAFSVVLLGRICFRQCECKKKTLTCDVFSGFGNRRNWKANW